MCLTIATATSTLGGCAPEHYPRFTAGGVQCAPNADIIYHVNDAGNNGAPPLTGDEAAMVSRIEKYIGRDRLEYLPTAPSLTIIDDPEPCQHGESITTRLRRGSDETVV